MASNPVGPGSPGASVGAPPEPRLTMLLTEDEVAALLQVTVKALQGWRYRGGGPRFVKVGRCVRYRREDLQGFVQAALRTSTSDPGPPIIPHYTGSISTRRS